MRSVDVSVDCRKLLVECVADVAFGREMITLVRADAFDHAVDARAALQRRQVK